MELLRLTDDIYVTWTLADIEKNSSVEIGQLTSALKHLHIDDANMRWY